MNGDVAGNQEVQALYEQISRLQMKLAASIEEADRKQRKFSCYMCKGFGSFTSLYSLEIQPLERLL